MYHTRYLKPQKKKIDFVPCVINENKSDTFYKIPLKFEVKLNFHKYVFILNENYDL